MIRLSSICFAVSNPLRYFQQQYHWWKPNIVWIRMIRARVVKVSRWKCPTKLFCVYGFIVAVALFSAKFEQEAVRHSLTSTVMSDWSMTYHHKAAQFSPSYSYFLRNRCTTFAHREARLAQFRCQRAPAQVEVMRSEVEQTHAARILFDTGRYSYVRNINKTLFNWPSLG